MKNIVSIVKLGLYFNKDIMNQNPDLWEKFNAEDLSITMSLFEC